MAASLNKGGRLIAFHSQTFSPSEHRYSAVKKEAAVISDAIQKWSHFLFSKRFQLITDQRAVSFLFNPTRLGKLKKTKIQLWRTELGNFDNNIVHRPGKQNIVPDTLSRVCSVMYNGLNLVEIHKLLSHSEVPPLSHFVKTKNLLFSVEDTKTVCLNCQICAEMKPCFSQKPVETLVIAMHPWERLSVNFKDPLVHVGKNKYVLFVADEFSCFPFAFPFKGMSSTTVISCLTYSAYYFMFIVIVAQVLFPEN